MTRRITRGTALVLPVVLVAGLLALSVAGAAVSAEDPCAVASPSASAEPSSSLEPTVEPSPSSSLEPTVESSPSSSVEPTVEPSPSSVQPTVEPSLASSPETAPVASDPASSAVIDPSPAPQTRAKVLVADEPVPSEPVPADPSASAPPCPEPLMQMAAVPLVLAVVPDPHDLVYGDPAPDYTFTLLDMTEPAAPVEVDPVTLAPLVIEPEVLAAYVAPVCSSDHEVEVPPADTDSPPTVETRRYTPGPGEGATSVAEAPLTITCLPGVLEGSTFDTTATALLTLAKAPTEVVTPPTPAGLTYGQTLHDSTLSGGSGSVAGYFTFPLDSWTVTPLVGTQNHVVAFVPEDFANYEPSTTTIDVTVGQATPVVVTPPTVSGLVTGQTLAEATLTGGVGSTQGTFAWTSPTTAPAEGTSMQQVTFTPADTSNFVTSPATTVDVPVTVTPPPLDYATAGYLGRVEMGDVTNLIRPRVMVPLPFTVTGGDVGDLALVESFDPVAISCEALVDNATEVFPSVTIGRRSRLVYDAANGRFVQFWKVPATRNTCYRVTTTIADGDTIVAYFKTR